MLVRRSVSCEGAGASVGDATRCASTARCHRRGRPRQRRPAGLPADHETAGISWQSPAGAVEPGETREDVALRETQEETGTGGLCREAARRARPSARNGASVIDFATSLQARHFMRSRDWEKDVLYAIERARRGEGRISFLLDDLPGGRQGAAKALKLAKGLSKISSRLIGEASRG